MSNLTAVARLYAKNEGDAQTALLFHADYNDDRNKEWSQFTPSLTISMTVLNSIAEKIATGSTYLLTFQETE